MLAIIVLAACLRPAGPRVLDHQRLCGSLDVYLVADRRGWYVVQLLKGSEHDALSAIDHAEPMDEDRAVALFEETTDPETTFGADP